MKVMSCRCRALHPNPFQRHSESTAASVGGITQSALQEANALLDLRVDPILSAGGSGDAPTAGSRFSAALPPSGGGSVQMDTSAAGTMPPLQHLPLRLLSGHNSGNTFSGVPHGYRVEAGGEAAALLAVSGTASGADAAHGGGGGGGGPTAQTASRSSTGGDMAPPPPRHAVEPTAATDIPSVLLPATEVTSQVCF